MATTKTKTNTQTNTRIEFILNHFRSALKRLTNFDNQQITEVLDGIENEEIASLDFIGYIPQHGKNDVYVRLQLAVDWDEHHRLRKEQPKITYDNRFDEGSCPEIYGLIMMTQNTIEKNKLMSSVLYGYSDHIRNNKIALTAARKKYGTSPTSTEYDYSRLKRSESCYSPEAPELSAKCDL